MFELPKDCYVNKFLPKKIFYEKVGVSSGVKDEFVNLVDRITWLYKLSPEIFINAFSAQWQKHAYNCAKPQTN